ncbi:hypothetical protein AX14_002946 [Amanita brunnescens Koide BX004]|nr:hypothetical protein AX14_002946 [Amanita brunnescens Koide BX004]
MSALRVSFLCALFLIVGYSSQIFIIWPWYSRVPPGPPLNLARLLLPFNFLVGMMLWNYFLTISTDPGRVPDYWNLNAKETKEKLRYCSMCEKYKPPRAHHCATCNRCVLRMDHHCPWLNSCVGHSNYGHYTRFFFYANLTCIYHLAMVSKCLQDRTWVKELSTEVAFVANYAACISTLYNTLNFSTTHFHRLLRNRTVIEILQERKSAAEHTEAKFPYDLGVRCNIESLLGASIWLWWWPCRASGDGLSFSIAEGSEEPWPPQEPDQAMYEIQLPSSCHIGGNVDYNQDVFSFDPKPHDAASLRPRRAILFTASPTADDN